MITDNKVIEVGDYLWCNYGHDARKFKVIAISENYIVCESIGLTLILDGEDMVTRRPVLVKKKSLFDFFKRKDVQIPPMKNKSLGRCDALDIK